MILDGGLFILRVPHERKKENKKQEVLPEDQPLPDGQMLQKGEGVQIFKDKAKDTGGDKATKEGPSLGRTEPRKDAKETYVHGIRKGFRYVAIAQFLKVHVAHLPQQGPFRHFMDMKAEKRLAGRKECRSRFGDISVRKCYQFGQIFSPFQALATTEMQRLVFPRDLPMSPNLQRMGISCTTEGNLQDSELGVRKDDSNHKKEKPVSHIKMPLFPPIVKATKSNDMK
ncbi:uncharacterized protein LOC110570366 [Neomonachus schauinslandi]|uniref:Uncharacterized protein LOC110570366 n=1 Tax=Neomonachus schauinslandi TaxID=29088 RepID=A0A2Y9G4U3_NEOSC|nr:uncharacterized protein LOC110570366 [Neomonachus schauinslandi]